MACCVCKAASSLHHLALFNAIAAICATCEILNFVDLLSIDESARSITNMMAMDLLTEPQQLSAEEHVDEDNREPESSQFG